MIWVEAGNGEVEAGEAGENGGAGVALEDV